MKSDFSLEITENILILLLIVYVCYVYIYILVFFFESSLAWLDVEVRGQCWEYSSIPLRLFNFVFSLNYELSISARRVDQ